MFSATFMWSNSALFWNSMPIFLRTRASSRVDMPVMHSPSTKTLAAIGL